MELELKERDLSPEEPVSVLNQEGASERRASARFALSESVEAVEVRTQTRVSGRLSDIAFGGCYIDTVSPFPSGTSLLLVLGGDRKIQVKAKVVYALPGMGMGLMFTDLDSTQRQKLNAWLRELGGSDSSEVTARLSLVDATPAARQPGMADVLRDLIELLRERGVLSETEAASLRDKIAESS